MALPTKVLLIKKACNLHIFKKFDLKGCLSILCWKQLFHCKDGIIRGSFTLYRHIFYATGVKNRPKIVFVSTKINLLFVTLNQIFTDRKLNLTLQHLPSLCIYRNAKKTQTDQGILHVFYFVWKEATNKP